MASSFRIGVDSLYRCDAFEQFSWLSHAFGTRLANPAADVTLKQIHSDRVHNAAGLADRQLEGDGLVTNEPELTVAVRTADCIPLLLVDAVRRSVAAVHAGWRGGAARIAERTLDRMRDDFGTQAPDVYAAIGPCIRACCYQVGADVAKQFEGWSVVDDHGYLDLAGALRQQLMSRGVHPAHIFDSGLCTSCRPALLYSYRRDPGDPGRMLSAIRLH